MLLGGSQVGSCNWSMTALVRPSLGKRKEQMGISSGTCLWRKSFTTRQDGACWGRDPSCSQAQDP